MKFAIVLLAFVAVCTAQRDPAHTYFQFSHAMNSCDQFDDVAYDGTAKVIYAYNDRDPVNGIPSQHTVKGALPLDFKTAPFTQPLEANTKTIDFRRPALELPYGTRKGSLNSTYYWSSGWDLWELFAAQGITVNENQAIHITKWGMLFDEDHYRNMHHLNIIPCPEIEHCPECLQEENWGESGTYGKEGEDTVPKVLNDCWLQTGTAPVMAWVLGTEPQQFPMEAGLKVGGPDGMRYVLLGLHYDLPSYAPDDVKIFGEDYAPEGWEPEEIIVDTTGIRMWYTQTLRPNDIGFAWIAVNPDRDNFQVPPHQREYTVYAISNPNCWDPLFPPGVEEVQVMQVLQHGHDQNIRLRTRHIRNGVELPYVGDDPHYNNYYQQWVSKEFKWRQGDIFIVECTIGTLDFNRTLTGGIDTDEQMCISMFMHYPALGATSKIEWSIYRTDVKGETWTSNPGEGIDCQGEQYGWPDFVALPEERECTERRDPAVLGDTTVRPMQAENIDFSSYEHHRVLDAIEMEEGKFTRVIGDGKYNLYWTYHSDSDTIDFLVDVETTGWIGFGVSPTGGMKDADIILMYVDDATGEPHIWDMHGIGEINPVMDSMQDIFNAKGYQDYITYRPTAADHESDSTTTSSDSEDCAMEAEMLRGFEEVKGILRGFENDANRHDDNLRDLDDDLRSLGQAMQQRANDEYPHKDDGKDDNTKVVKEESADNSRGGGGGGTPNVFVEVVGSLILLLSAASFFLLWKSRKRGYVAAATDDDLEMRVS